MNTVGEQPIGCEVDQSVTDIAGDARDNGSIKPMDQMSNIFGRQFLDAMKRRRRHISNVPGKMAETIDRSEVEVMESLPSRCRPIAALLRTVARVRHTDPVRKSLTVSGQNLIHDTIDGETIIIDTVGGRLSMLGGAAAMIWLAAVAGIDPDLLTAAVADRFGDQAAQQTQDFIDQLSSLGLVSVVAEPGTDPGSLDWPSDWATPSIDQFEDIADIMTMDPIHEVDPTQGWPRQPPPVP